MSKVIIQEKNIQAQYSQYSTKLYTDLEHCYRRNLIILKTPDKDLPNNWTAIYLETLTFNTLAHLEENSFHPSEMALPISCLKLGGFFQNFFDDFSNLLTLRHSILFPNRRRC